MNSKIRFGTTLLLFLLTATSCQTHKKYSDVVRETYIHQYGVPVIKSDWNAQGREGKIVKLKKNGVTLTQSYAKGILHGESTYTFPSSSVIQFIEIYDNGTLVAKRENFPSGIAMREEKFDQGILSEFNSWYEDGTPNTHEMYRGDSLVKGEYRTPMNVNEGQIQNGQGMRIRRSSHGELLSRDTIQNGKMVARMTYFSNGDPKTITPYSKGEIEGTRLTFLQGGVPNTSEQWVHGKKEGITVIYRNGEKYAEVPYIGGSKNGIEARYTNGSILVEEITWKNNMRHGEHKFYIDGGTKIEWYNQGELVNWTGSHLLKESR
ncbi:MAG: hypothetical protein R3E91_04110 [Chlamydiales bacterium]